MTVKLVRDRIPEIHRQHGMDEYPNATFRECANDDELLGRLKSKLLEEAFEVLSATVAAPAHLLEELADVYEVLLAIAHQINATEQDIQNRANIKRAERGGFERGWLLVRQGGWPYDLQTTR